MQSLRNALVTGGAGFIGSHLTELLLASGCRVTIVDDESTGSFQNLAAASDHERLTIVQGDVMDRSLVRELVAEVDEVYHLAASVGVQRIADSPIESIERNIAPSSCCFRSSRKNSARAARPSSSSPAAAKSTVKIRSPRGPRRTTSCSARRRTCAGRTARRRRSTSF